MEAKLPLGSIDLANTREKKIDSFMSEANERSYFRTKCSKTGAKRQSPQVVSTVKPVKTKARLHEATGRLQSKSGPASHEIAIS